MSSNFNIEEVLSKLSITDKISLLAGQGLWHTHAVTDLGVLPIRMSDGPNGIRGTRFFNGVPSSCFPSSTGLGSSFDIDLANQVGKALGDEARAKSCHVVLAPTVNTQRSPLGGRGFESFSEDPYLNGTIAAAYVNGVQSKGVAATIKHFVANDQEFERFSISSEVSERALREIYLKPFQIVIKNSDPWALMTAYNRVNGVHASEDKKLLTDILRKEWGFKGLVMSDWTGVYSTTESIKAGLDLEMPGPTVMRGNAVLRALMGEKLSISDIDDRVRNILGLLKRAYDSGIPFNGPEEGINTPELRQLLRTAAADAIVLLKNDKHILPLATENVKRIAVIGYNAKQAITSGGGSAQLLPTYTVSPLQGITTVAKEIGAEVEYAPGANTYKYLPLLDPYIHHSSDARLLLDFWNDIPTEDYLSTHANVNKILPDPNWSTHVNTSLALLADGIDESKVRQRCFLRLSTEFVPDQDGDWEFGVNLAGRGNLFLDKKLVLDLSNHPQSGDPFSGLGGGKEIRVTVNGLKSGQAYHLELRWDNAAFLARSAGLGPMRGGVRLGVNKHVTDKDAITEAVALAKGSDITVLVVGLNHDYESEGFDRPDIELPGHTNQLVFEVLKANPNTVVVNQSGVPVAMPWIDDAATVLQAFYGGNELGNGLADVLFGKVNPSGKLALTFPKRLEDTPSYPSFGNKGQEHGKILYNEGIFVGYRSYEIRDLAPLFPFGYGISYTTFEYSGLSTSSISSDGSFSVSFTVKNIGTVNGREISQVYIADPQSSLPRPVKELKGFAKTELKFGESKTVTIELNREALGFYDDQRSVWVAEAGVFEVNVGASSADIRLKGEVTLKDPLSWTGL